MSLSVALSVKNEAENIGPCLKLVRKIADEIIVVDDDSKDRTGEIAKSFGAKVYEFKHKKNFHETKQKAIERSTKEWILQLDADERVTPRLAKEIKKVIKMTNEEIKKRKMDKKKQRLFLRHQRAVEMRDGKIGKQTGEIVAFFIPRVNMFLGRPLRHAGVYPDGVIRLIKNGKAYLPAKSVHEQMVIDGQVAWLENDLEHHDSPTLRRYLSRANRYTDLTASDFEQKKVSKNIFALFFYSFVKPPLVFFKLFIRHKGFVDGIRGFLWSLFSALHFPIAYFKYWTAKDGEL